MSDGESLNLDTRGSRPNFFENPETDALMTALLETMSHLWAAKEYTRALEKVLVKNGVIPADAVDSLQWEPEEAAALAEERQLFLNDALRAMRADFQTVGQRNEAIDRFQSSGGEDAS